MTKRKKRSGIETRKKQKQKSRSKSPERGQGLAGVVSLFIGEQLNEVDPLATRPTPADEPGQNLDPTLDLISQSFKHCDEYIEDPTQPECLRKFLDRARSPAHGRFGPGSEKPYPTLYATYQGKDWQGVCKGDRVRVTMASRMGDVGCTKNLNADHGYQIRTAVADLNDFSETPY